MDLFYFAFNLLALLTRTILTNKVGSVQGNLDSSSLSDDHMVASLHVKVIIRKLSFTFQIRHTKTVYKFEAFQQNLWRYETTLMLNFLFQNHPT